MFVDWTAKMYDDPEKWPIQINIPPIPPIPQVNPYQIHQKFQKIKIQKLAEVLTKGCINALPTYPDVTKFSNKVYKWLYDLIPEENNPSKRRRISTTSELSGEEIERMKENLSQLNSKIDVYNYSMTIPQEGYEISIEELVRLSLCYVYNQPQEFQLNYIRFYLLDCMTAYDAVGSNAISCAGGVVERIITSLQNGGIGIDNPEYNLIASYIRPELDQQGCLGLIQKCISTNKVKLLELKDDESGMLEKKKIIYECSLGENRELSDKNKDDIKTLITNLEDMITNESLIGGKRLRTRRKVIKKLKTRKVMKKPKTRKVMKKPKTRKVMKKPKTRKVMKKPKTRKVMKKNSGKKK
jgi:hypothetical protein